MKLTKAEVRLATNSLNELLTNWSIENIVALAGSVSAVESLHARLAAIPLPEEERSTLVEVELNSAERKLISAALEECLRDFGHMDGWDFPVRMGGWPHEAAHLAERLKQE